MKGRRGKQRWPGEDGDTGKQDKGQRSKPEAAPGTLEEKPVSTSPASTCCLLDVANLVAQEASKQHPPAVARIIPHHLLSSRGDTDLRIRGCQLQMNHSLHGLTGFVLKPSKLPGKIPLHSETSDVGHTKLQKWLHRDCLRHANLALAYVCLMKQICNHRIACSFSPTRPMPRSVLRMVLLAECSISHHFFSLSFKLLPCSLLLSSPLFSTLHPSTASTDYTGST